MSPPSGGALIPPYYLVKIALSNRYVVIDLTLTDYIHTM